MLDPIIIVGVPRSGTSMTAGVIEQCGAFGGNTDSNKKKRQFENITIQRDITKPFFITMKSSPTGHKNFPNIYKVKEVCKNDTLVSNFRNAVISVINNQGYKEGSWYIKDSRITLIWPIWNAAFPKAKWIIVRRDVEDIVRSCLRTDFMDTYNTRSGWLSLVSEYERHFEDMYNSKLIIGEVWPQRMINGDFAGIQLIINNLQLEWNKEKIMGFVEPKLWAKGLSRTGKGG